MTTKKSRLSTWLPTAIRQGVADMLETLRNPKYTINMYDWYCPKKCTVCLAGAVMVARCDISDELKLHHEQISPSLSGDNGTRKMLSALNLLRMGQIGDAVIMSGSTGGRRVDEAYTIYDRHNAQVEGLYHEDKHGYIPFGHMLWIADQLDELLPQHGYVRPSDDEEIYISDAMLTELETLAGRK